MSPYDAFLIVELHDITVRSASTVVPQLIDAPASLIVEGQAAFRWEFPCCMDWRANCTQPAVGNTDLDLDSARLGNPCAEEVVSSIPRLHPLMRVLEQ